VCSTKILLHAALHKWDKEFMFGPRQHLRELHKELKDVLSGTLTDDAVEKEKEIQIKIKTLLEQEEIYWVQRGRDLVTPGGPKYQKKFHGFASARKRESL
jgi:hypothetical protein